MPFVEILKSAITSLRSNVLRTALTMLGIVIGISSVILIISLGQSATRAITDELSSFGTDFFGIVSGSLEDASAFGGTIKTLVLDDAEAIESDPSLTNVKAVSPLVTASSIASANGESKRLSIFGVKTEFFGIFKPNIVYGRIFSEDESTGFSKVAVIGIDAAEVFFGEDHDPVGEVLRVDGRPYRIIGVVESDSNLGPPLNDTLYIPLSVVMKQILGQDHLFEIHVLVYDTDFINQTIEDVEVLLRDRHDIEGDEDDDFTIQSFKDALSTLDTITGLLTSFVAAISGISLIVGGIGIMNIMLVTVTERTKEIGLLKAIGAKNKDILTQFLVESVVMTLIGGIAGILIGVLGAFGISQAVGIPFVMSPVAIVVSVGVSTVVGIIFGLYPARRAARLSPIDALRHE